MLKIKVSAKIKWEVMLKLQKSSPQKKHSTCSNSELCNMVTILKAHNNSWTTDNFQSIALYVQPQ